jgi:hypothetical protein
MEIYGNNFNDCGIYGKATEVNIKAILHLAEKVARAGQTDLRKNRVCYEIKTGAGELGNVGGKLVKGSSMVIYIPVVNEQLTVLQQEGFVMSRELFLETLENCGMIREKTATNGTRKITIQTFWNRSKNQPHGKGYARMLDAFYDLEGNGVQTLQEWLEEFI